MSENVAETGANRLNSPSRPSPMGDAAVGDEFEDPSGSTEQFRAFLHGTPEPESPGRRTPVLVTLAVLVILVLAAVAWLVFGS